MQHCKPKVFFIGFNKTATTSFHYYFQRNRFTSYHYTLTKDLPYPKNCLAYYIQQNVIANNSILNGIEDACVYSDMCYLDKNNILFEGNKFFVKMHEENPDAYFVLQIRNVEDWIRSRLNHQNGKFANVICKGLNTNKKLLREIWREEYFKHLESVRYFFRSSNNFLKFDIDVDKIDKLNDFLRNDYTLNNKYWKKLNASK